MRSRKSRSRDDLRTSNSLGRDGVPRGGLERDRLIDALDSFAPLETTSDHVRGAVQVQRLLAQRSQRGRKIPDLLVAAAAEGHHLIVLHHDGDFDLIASVTGQRCRWIVPAGSAD